MKTRLLFGCLLLNLITLAQPRLVNRDLRDSTLPLLYIGVDNTIELVNPGVDEWVIQTTLRGAGGMLAKSSRNQFIARVKETGNTRMESRDSKADTVLAGIVFKCISLEGKPIAYFAGARDTSLVLNEILLNPSITASYAASNYAGRFNVASASVVFVQNGKRSVATPSAWGRLSAQQRNVAKTLRKGDAIEIRDIKGNFPGGEVISGLAVVIKIR